jgi:hypothetical protein
MTTVWPVLLDLLRFIRDCMGYLGELNIRGFPLDWVFHFIFAFLLMLLLNKFLSIKKCIWIVCFLIVLKEVVDVFGKSRLDYIVPPEIDLPKDILAGLAGLLLYLKYHKHSLKQKLKIKEKQK